MHTVLAEPTQRVGTVDALMDEVAFFLEISRQIFVLPPSCKLLGKLFREKVQINSVGFWVVLVSERLVEQLGEEVDVEHVADPGTMRNVDIKEDKARTTESPDLPVEREEVETVPGRPQHQMLRSRPGQPHFGVLGQVSHPVARVEDVRAINAQIVDQQAGQGTEILGNVAAPHMALAEHQVSCHGVDH